MTWLLFEQRPVPHAVRFRSCDENDRPLAKLSSHAFANHVLACILNPPPPVRPIQRAAPHRKVAWDDRFAQQKRPVLHILQRANPQLHCSGLSRGGAAFLAPFQPHMRGEQWFFRCRVVHEANSLLAASKPNQAISFANHSTNQTHMISAPLSASSPREPENHYNSKKHCVWPFQSHCPC